MEAQFHCTLPTNFRSETEQLRAFTYHDYSIPPHTHDFCELNIITAGHGIHSIKGKSFPAEVGSVFFIPPQTPHAYSETQELSVFHILIRPELLAENYAEASRVNGYLLLTEIEPYLRAETDTAAFLKLTTEQLRLLEPEFNVIRDKSPFSAPEFEALRIHTLWKILYLLSAFIATEQNPRPSPHKYEQAILKALAYIHQNFGEKITVESLCSAAFLSRSTFLRSFQAVCGCTPHEYLRNFRIRHALELLEEGALSRTEIAHRCGFYDLAHFERAVKRYQLNQKVSVPSDLPPT